MNWFSEHGGKCFTFLALSSASLQGLDGLPKIVSQAIIIIGILATAAHQSFFQRKETPK